MLTYDLRYCCISRSRFSSSTLSFLSTIRWLVFSLKDLSNALLNVKSNHSSMVRLFERTSIVCLHESIALRMFSSIDAPGTKSLSGMHSFNPYASSMGRRTCTGKAYSLSAYEMKAWTSLTPGESEASGNWFSINGKGTDPISYRFDWIMSSSFCRIPGLNTIFFLGIK